jgi:hypothetical protein
MNKGRAQSLMTLAGAVGTAWMLGCMNPTDSAKNDDSLAMSQAGSADAGGGVGKTTICHIPPGNPANAHTITVGNPAVRAHLAHGDKIGSCPDVVGKKPKCSDEVAEGASHHGMSPDRAGAKVAVCHIPPGNPANMHTIVIGAAAVRAHLAHGDKLGACEGETAPVAVSTDCGSSTNHGNGGNPHDGNDSGNGTGTGTGEGGNDSGGSGGGSGTDTTLNY